MTFVSKDIERSGKHWSYSGQDIGDKATCLVSATLFWFASEAAAWDKKLYVSVGYLVSTYCCVNLPTNVSIPLFFYFFF